MGIGTKRIQEVFVIKESTAGTLEAPTAGDVIMAFADPVMNQPREYTNSQEIKNSRDVTDRFANKVPPGVWSLSAYVKPSGSAGSVPQEAVLLDCLSGDETIVGSTSVTYSPALQRDTCSIWIKRDHTVFFGRGCTVDQAELGVSLSDAAQWNFSGQARQVGRVGTDAIDGAHSISDTAITVDDASLFSVGGYVEFVEGGVVKNNSDSGYEITAVNTTTNILTIGTGLEEALDDNTVIRPWLPAGSEVGSPVENAKASATLGGTAFNMRSLSVTFSDPMTFLQEISSDTYPEDSIEGMRETNGSMELYFREANAQYFETADEGTAIALVLTVGDTAGSIMTVTFTYARLDYGEVGSADEALTLTIPFYALGSSGEDSYSIAYT